MAKIKAKASAKKKSTAKKTVAKKSNTKKAVSKKKAPAKKLVSKASMVSQIAKSTGLSAAKAEKAYETVLKNGGLYKTQSVTKTIPVKVELVNEYRIVEVEKKVLVVKEVKDTKETSALKKKMAALEKSLKAANASISGLKKKLAAAEKGAKAANAALSAANKKCAAAEKSAKTAKADLAGAKKKLASQPKVKTVIKKVEVIKEVPVEIIKEVEVVKQIDFASLEKMMKGMKTVQVSKTVIGETRTKKAGKIVERREVKSGSKSTKTSAKAGNKKDDLTKIEGIGPKISELLHNAKISTFKKLADTKPSKIREVLDKAGPRFQMHDPGLWPKQAQLAADGNWKELETLQDRLIGGKQK